MTDKIRTGQPRGGSSARTTAEDTQSVKNSAIMGIKNARLIPSLFGMCGEVLNNAVSFRYE